MSQSQLNSNATDARSQFQSNHQSSVRWQPLAPSSPIAEKSAIIMNQRQKERIVSEAVKSGLLPHQIKERQLVSP